MDDIIKSHVQKIQALPTIPATANEILNLTSDPMLSIDKLRSIVERDPPIAAKILSVANSAFFGYPNQTTQLDDAIIKIGFNNVKSIAVGISVLSFLGDGKKTSDYKRLFNHSVAVGLTARYIAKNLEADIAEDLLINGLLHDLGHFVLHRYFADVYGNILNSLDHARSLLDAEKDILSYTHADVGYWLAEQWNLPDTILDTVLYHHAPSLAERDAKLLAIIHIADYIAVRNMFRPIEQDPNYPLDLNCFAILKLSDSILNDIEGSVGSILSSDEIFAM